MHLRLLCMPYVLHFYKIIRLFCSLNSRCCCCCYCCCCCRCLNRRFFLHSFLLSFASFRLIVLSNCLQIMYKNSHQALKHWAPKFKLNLKPNSFANNADSYIIVVHKMRTVIWELTERTYKIHHFIWYILITKNPPSLSLGWGSYLTAYHAVDTWCALHNLKLIPKMDEFNFDQLN